MNIKNMTKVEQDEFKTKIKQGLSKGTVRVSFLKQNGQERVMNCTTNPQVTPVPAINRNADIMTVFDVDAKDWRSFRWDRVINAVA